MPTLLQDIRYTLRQMRESPGFSLIAILTLALGVGAATAIYSVVDAVILQPLPYSQPNRIVVPNTIAKEGYQQPPSWPSYLDMVAQNHTFSELAGYSAYDSTNLQAKSGPVALRLVAGTANFFKVFGVQPILGRTYRPDEDQPGKNDVAVLSYEVWKTNFDGASNVIGRKIDLDGKPYTCIGVMPAGFTLFGIRHAIYTPIDVPAKWRANRGTHWLQLIGRLKPGVTQSQAQADMNQVLANLSRAYPDTDAGRKAQLLSVAEMTYGRESGGLWTLVAAALAVLAIGCINLAGLLLSRGVRREREMALRTAIGATRTRIVRQILTESIVLAACGALGGTALAGLLLSTMRTFLIHAIARGANAHIEWKALAAALVLSVATSILASMVLALRLAGTDPNRVLKAGGGAGVAAAQHRLRSTFIITQIALSLVLLAVAGVLLRSVIGYRNENLGFDPHHILTTEIDLAPARYESKDVWNSFYLPLLNRVRNLHGVKGAGLINMVPIQASGMNQEIHIFGQPPYPPNEVTLAEMRFVSPGYFDAMGIRLLRGRVLSPALDLSTNKSGSIVVNQAFVKKFIPAPLNPIGQHLDDADKLDQKTRIVGEVTNVRQSLMRPDLPEMDWLYTELAHTDRSTYLMSTHLMVRTSGDPRAVIPDLRSILHQLDPTVPFRAPETMEQVISDQLVMQRMESWLFGIFAGLAVLLAIVGLYGLISHEVGLRTKDIGVRMALGASRQSVLALILQRVAILLAVGVACGLMLTEVTQKLIASIVNLQVAHQADLLLFISIALAAAGFLAALLPAWRAASIDPMRALRSE